MMTWRSLDYTYRMETYDLTSLPSEISTLGYFQEDTEEYRGVYVMEDISEDISEDIRYAEELAVDVFDVVDPYHYIR
jgi:hypothetical protein